MTGLMTAAVYYGPGDVRIEMVDRPERRQGEAMIRVVRSGMCGTDATEWRTGPLTFPVNRVHPVTGHTGPMIPGHEFIGEILDIDEDSDLSVGDLVVSGAGVWCGECARCLEGRTNLCSTYYTLGLNIAGGMAEFASVPVKNLVRVPHGMSPDVAGLAQPLAVGLHAARRAGVASGDRVIIIGAGAIGTFVLAGLLSLGDADITVVDFPGKRLERSARVGATRVVPAGEGAASDIDAAIGVGGADVVIEASGATGQLANALSLVRVGGRVLQVGLPSADQPINVHSFVMREVTIDSTLAHVCDADLAPALQILATTSLAAELLDSVNPLSALPALLDDLARGRIEGKVLFDPSLPMDAILRADGGTTTKGVTA
ncbi:threonine dehydrogenase [Salinibacterium xinjiangense]|uniref:(R,R)-butanediol dehydrogenase / meso-butanediol dehydrogenase / diacetyl reductase n=1 Tax=Salinibacterium xinjiangense TaxID=386302 RepID=A0A2C8YFS0_9MICO|nr:alcohol dehydrogenase catalytic domain-containing protein [Salinibacterium xinjiangense]GGK96907.1 threonine dehydrogenase [Salinibacterium xinjiangense]SOE49155.1 (R,R)-butanediol dehydrogenase / meso-butanediol dehydrogenase / diacetyl reductase [Salinibacterium xinjiangense]